MPSICAAISGNLIQNCGFEAGTTTLGSDTVPVDWNPAGDWVNAQDRVVGPVIYANSGDYVLGLGNNEASPYLQGTAGVSQTFSDVAGQEYEVSFFLANDASNPLGDQGFELQWDSTVEPIPAITTDTCASDGSSCTYTQYSFYFTGAGSDTLTLSGYSNIGSNLVDDVCVALASTGCSVVPVPEPSSLTLLGVATLGATMLRRRRSRSSHS